MSASPVPARVQRITLTEDHYNNPSNYAPAIQFATNDDGHPFSTIRYGEISVGTPISLLQCKCKHVEETEVLKRSARMGYVVCALCREPLEISDILTRTERIAQFIIKGLIVSTALLPVLYTIYALDIGEDRVIPLIFLAILTTGVNIWKEGNGILYDGIKADILPKIARAFIENVPTGIASIFAANIVVTSFLYRFITGGVIQKMIIGGSAGYVGNYIFTKTKEVAKSGMDRISNFFPAFRR